MKKIILLVSLSLPISFCLASFDQSLSYRNHGVSFGLPEPSIVDKFFNLIDWILLSLVPIFIIFFFAWGIFYFFKKDSGKNKKKKSLIKADLSWKSIILRLIIPLTLFSSLFTVSRSRINYSCDCFENYSEIVSFFVSIAFFIGAVLWAYSMKKNKKEWKFVYTILTLVLFLIAFYLFMWIGEYFSVPKF